MNRDMFKYRKNREQSKVAKLWQEWYKNSIFQDVLFCYRANSEGKGHTLKLLRDNPETVEIVADTLIGWLNSPVGRSFINESFGTSIPLTDDNGDEAI